MSSIFNREFFPNFVDTTAHSAGFFKTSNPQPQSQSKPIDTEVCFYLHLSHFSDFQNATEELMAGFPVPISNDMFSNKVASFCHEVHCLVNGFNKSTNRIHPFSNIRSYKSRHVGNF